MSLFKRKQEPTKSENNKPSFAAIMIANRTNSLKDAQNEAHDRGFSLDFTPDSIKVVDKVLESMRKELLALGRNSYEEMVSTRGILGCSMFMAEYIASVIDKNVAKGEWVDAEIMPYEAGYKLGEQVIFPVGWCLKRIGNGSEDSIYVKYSYFVSQMKPKKSKA